MAAQTDSYHCCWYQLQFTWSITKILIYHISSSRSLQWVTQIFICGQLLKCLTELELLSTATLEEKGYMKLEEIGNNITRKILSCIYIATLLLKQFTRATKVDIWWLSLKHVGLAILYLLISGIPVKGRIFICALYPSQQQF